jgi:putative oxygen-independent coproporphyrinogen III oxidase
MERDLGADIPASARPNLSTRGGPNAAGRRFTGGPPPLSLYVHIPWCVRKCPYCDFNSHRATGRLPEDAYVAALLSDLDHQLRTESARRQVRTIFIGGGTPSLFSGLAIAHLLDGIRARCPVVADAEITLEANPGAVDTEHFAAYRRAGVNRLSIGVQSLNAEHLLRLGRIHDPDQARDALRTARAVGFDNINLDMMFGLPGQDLRRAREDLSRLIDLGPEHISYYQLTLEPNTAFAHAPPQLPEDDRLDEMQELGAERLAAAGYPRYEISAYAAPARRCAHNLNYWRFGDYLGIGAGAHGKLTDVATGVVERRACKRSPTAYLDADERISERRMLDDDDLVLEFALNALRLVDGVDTRTFGHHTGIPPERLNEARARATASGLLGADPGRLAATPLGLRFLNDLVAVFG